MMQKSYVSDMLAPYVAADDMSTRRVDDLDFYRHDQPACWRQRHVTAPSAPKPLLLNVK
jgi:hypothetical protein